MPGQEIPPRPVPTVWGFDHVTTGSHVVAIANTPLGTSVYFIELQNVDAFCAALQQQKEKALAAAAQPDIVVPGQTLLDVNGNPLTTVGPSQEVLDHLARMQQRDAAIDVDEVDEPEGETGDSAS